MRGIFAQCCRSICNRRFICSICLLLLRKYVLLQSPCSFDSFWGRSNEAMLILRPKPIEGCPCRSRVEEPLELIGPALPALVAGPSVEGLEVQGYLNFCLDAPQPFSTQAHDSPVSGRAGRWICDPCALPVASIVIMASFVVRALFGLFGICNRAVLGR